jgi:hypothetical protein
LTNDLCLTGGLEMVKESAAPHLHTWLPCHFSVAVAWLHWYVLLNIGVALFLRLLTVFAPVRRERYLRVAFLTALGLFAGVVGWCAFLVGSQYYFCKTFVPPSPVWEGFPEESLRQMVLWYITPALFFGGCGLLLSGLLWRSALKALGTLHTKAE